MLAYSSFRIQGSIAIYKCNSGVIQEAYLSIQLNVGSAKSNKSCEEGLVEVAVLLKSHIFDNRRQLMMISYQNDAL